MMRILGLAALGLLLFVCLAPVFSGFISIVFTFLLGIEIPTGVLFVVVHVLSGLMTIDLIRRTAKMQRDPRYTKKFGPKPKTVKTTSSDEDKSS